MTAIRHHYFSKFYVKGFVAPGKKQLVRINLNTGEIRDKSPRAVGGADHFNTVRIDGVAPDAVESSYAEFETRAGAAIKRVCEKNLFEGDDRILVLNLVALFGVRSPHMRSHFTEARRQMVEKMLDVAFATEERWKQEMERLRRSGYEVNDDVTYEDVVRFLRPENHTFSVNNEEHIRTEVRLVDTVLECLEKRSWRMIRTTEEIGWFVTTDNPVGLAWLDPETVPAIHRNSPGHCLKGTWLYFPLRKDCALVGFFGGRDEVIAADRRLVALMNCHLMTLSQGEVYSPTRDFYWLPEDGEIRCGM